MYISNVQALIWAASNGHSALVVLLLSHGADMYAESADAFLPCHYACMYGHVHTVKTFLQLGYDVNATSSSRETALISTCRCEPGQTDFDKQTEIARILCDAGAGVHAENDPGDTPIITAAEWDNLPLCLLLISRGADPDKKNHDMQSAYTQVGFGFEENEENGELDLFADQRLGEEDKEVRAEMTSTPRGNLSVNHTHTPFPAPFPFSPLLVPCSPAAFPIAQPAPRTSKGSPRWRDANTTGRAVGSSCAGRPRSCRCCRRPQRMSAISFGPSSQGSRISSATSCRFCRLCGVWGRVL